MANETTTIVPFGKPAWSREASIGDYDGSVDKEDSKTEGDEPYAAMWWRELRAMRGSAYTLKTSTIVDAENVALARHFAAVWSRTPEKVRANASPGRSDERLDYWAEVLNVPNRKTESRWTVRENCAAHYVASLGPTLANVQDSATALLGDAYVAVHTTTGANLASPPASTFWPGVNPGDQTYNLGGGTWSSSRCHLWIEAVWPSGMSRGDFDNLTRVQAFQLFDRLLPAHATFSTTVGDGFILGTSLLGYDALTDA